LEESNSTKHVTWLGRGGHSLTTFKKIILMIVFLTDCSALKSLSCSELPPRNAAAISRNARAFEARVHGKENNISRLEKGVLQAIAGFSFLPENIYGESLSVLISVGLQDTIFSFATHNSKIPLNEV
jgi:hypothetical protein